MVLWLYMYMYSIAVPVGVLAGIDADMTVVHLANV